MAVAGMPEPRDDHALCSARMALAMRDGVRARFGERGIEVRIGLHSGPAVAGVIGQRKFAYDVWGDTVNTASRMESHGVGGRIQISDESATRLETSFVLQPRGDIDVKGKGRMRTWFLEGPRI